MSATLLGFLSAAISASCLAFLAASDSKRLPGRQAAFGSLRPLATAVAGLPGGLLALSGHWVAFFIWLGATAVLGWAVAAAAGVIEEGGRGGSSFLARELATGEALRVPPLLLVGLRNHQHAPQRGAVDGLLENGKIRKSPVDGVGAVARHKDDRNAAARQLVGQLINQFASEIDIKDRSLKLFTTDGVDRLGHSPERADHMKSDVAQKIGHHHSDKRFVFDQQARARS